jgi:hypothetical protein
VKKGDGSTVEVSLTRGLERAGAERDDDSGGARESEGPDDD